MEEKNVKKSKKIAVIFIVIFIIVLIIGAGIAWYIIANMDKNKPEEVLTQYIDYLSNKDYEGMYTLLSDSTKNRVDKDTYLARNKNIYEGIEATNISINNINIDEETKNITYTMSFDTLAGKLTYDFTATFDRQEDNIYYLNWYSNLIFPGLEEEFKIRVYSTTGSRGEILDRNGNILATNNENGEREYPYGEITTHLVDYIRGISEEEAKVIFEANEGKGYTESRKKKKNGLEAAFEDKLRGKMVQEYI